MYCCLSAPKVAGLLDNDRKNMGNPGAGSAAGNRGNPGLESDVVSTNVTVSEVSTNEIVGCWYFYQEVFYLFPLSGLQDCSDDLMYARLMNMQMNADLSEQDRLIAQQMSMTSQTPPDFLDTDAQLAYQQQLEIMVNYNYNIKY